MSESTSVEITEDDMIGECDWEAEAASELAAERRNEMIWAGPPIIEDNPRERFLWMLEDQRRLALGV